MPLKLKQSKKLPCKNKPYPFENNTYMKCSNILAILHYYCSGFDHDSLKTFSQKIGTAKSSDLDPKYIVQT